ncbi:hypothetical protein B0H16DRAFT_1453651 [Mycena metata]|uniref:Uncharacterized protein n=1 Tax=Mycena metata TaxID=1033252 RepID=A0AAD7NLZ6_9AGAR|nr:hypothetical protein B0H16DRAFT_1453651 [Mycena metata]
MVRNTIPPVDNANHQVGDQSTEDSDVNEDEEQNRAEAGQEPAHGVDQDPNPAESRVIRTGIGLINRIIGDFQRAPTSILRLNIISTRRAYVAGGRREHYLSKTPQPGFEILMGHRGLGNVAQWGGGTRPEEPPPVHSANDEGRWSKLRAAPLSYYPVDCILGGNRWTRFKVILFVANIVLSCYFLLALLFTLLTYFHTLENASILLIANTSKLALSTLTAAFALFVSLIGYPGILLNNRDVHLPLGLLVVPGYITYKRRTLKLEAKVIQQWSQELGAAGRLTIQSVLGCCGYFSPFVEVTVSATCYSRSILPGCKQRFLEFQEKALTRRYIVSFGLVPVHIGHDAQGLQAQSRGDGGHYGADARDGEDASMERALATCQVADQYGADAAAHIIANNSGNTGPCTQTHTRGTGSGLTGMGSGSGSGGIFGCRVVCARAMDVVGLRRFRARASLRRGAQMPPNPFSPNPTPAASASELNLAGPRLHQDEDGDEEGDGYSYGYGGVEDENEGGNCGRGGGRESMQSAGGMISLDTPAFCRVCELCKWEKEGKGRGTRLKRDMS